MQASRKSHWVEIEIERKSKGRSQEMEENRIKAIIKGRDYWQEAKLRQEDLSSNTLSDTYLQCDLGQVI